MDNDFEKIMQMMELFNLFKTEEPTQNKSENLNHESKDFFDSQIHSPSIMTIKAAIPFLDYHQQRNIGIMIKVIEIQKLIEIYSSQMVTQNKRNGEWRREMLQSIRPHIDENKRYMLDVLIKYMDIKAIMQAGGLVR